MTNSNDAALERIDVCEGKYTVINDNGKLSALRYGEPWRDLTGDNLIYWMMVEITSLREKNGVLVEALQAMEARFGCESSRAAEKPKTFACRHTAETCPACEGLVSGWKAVQLARAALPKARTA